MGVLVEMFKETELQMVRLSMCAIVMNFEDGGWDDPYKHSTGVFGIVKHPRVKGVSWLWRFLLC